MLNVQSTNVINRIPDMATTSQLELALKNQLDVGGFPRGFVYTLILLGVRKAPKQSQGQAGRRRTG
jgi:hypothetical protein